jgi:Flp pilus assembly protein TadD
VISAAQKALELDPELAEAHARLADIYQQQFRWSDAEAEYKQALELKPNDPATHRIFATWLTTQGRTEEAVARSRRARELDPLGTGVNSLCLILFEARHYDEATDELRSILALRPDDAEALWYLGITLIAKGRPQDAIPVLEKAVSVSGGSPPVVGHLIMAYAFAGRRADALRLLAELKRRRQTGYVPTPAFVNA